MNKIEMESSSGVFTVSLSYELEALDDVVNTLIIPCLLAAGYHSDTIKGVLGEE